MGRIYFYDALTREELLGHPLNGCRYDGSGANGASPRTGVQYEDTAWQVMGSTFVGGRAKPRTITAADFPGQLVVAKQWWPGRGDTGTVELRLLIQPDDGLLPLDKVECTGGQFRGSDGGWYTDHKRGRILRDRKALEFIAARRAALTAPVAPWDGAGRPIAAVQAAG